MCLITTQKTPHIATEDMVVYKVLREDSETSCRSIYESMIWTIGELYTTDIEDTDDICAADHIDSSWLTNSYPGWADGLPETLRCIGPGFHSTVTKERAKPCSQLGELYQCIIPAGSEYYLDATGLCVSNQLIVVKKVE